MSIDTVMKNFNKKFQDDLVQVGLSAYDYERIPFTSPRLNYMTFGGLPMGKLIEFYGNPGGGKTTTSLDVIANYQQIYDKKVLYIDAENTLDIVWATKLGVKVDDMIILNPTNQGAEDIFQFILDMIDTDEIGLVVIDSLGVMVSNQAMEKTVAEKTYGGIAMALTNFSKKAEGLCKKHNCTIIGINQMRDDLNSMYGGTTTTGGKAWKHNCLCRLEFRQGDFFDSAHKKLTRGAENPMGNYVQVTSIKNKSCPPTRRQGFYSLNYLTGIDYLYDLVEVATLMGLINKQGAWYTVIDEETGEIISDKIQGQDNMCKYLEDNIEILKKIENGMDKKIKDFNLISL